MKEIVIELDRTWTYRDKKGSITGSQRYLELRDGQAPGRF